MGIKVKLRRKDISGNRQSLYLDFWPQVPDAKGKLTRRQFLERYVTKDPRTAQDKQQNKEVLAYAETIRAKRENELNKSEIYSGYEQEQLRIREKQEQDFVAYFHALANARKASNHDNWVSAYHYLVEFTEGSLTFKNLTEEFCNDFREYLLTAKMRKRKDQKLSQNSALSYFNKFKAALKQAYKERYIQVDLNRMVSNIKEADTKRENLSWEELQQLAQTACSSPVLKSAALFSVLTGLRFSDIHKMVWSEVRFSEEQGYFLDFTHQKTKRVNQVHNISEEAYQLLGERKADTERVFEGLKYIAYHSRHLYQWIAKAGISRNITFHSFRHTYAMLQLNSLGTDMTVISKLLGHKNIKTTMTYARITDRTKREAANKMTLNPNLKKS